VAFPEALSPAESLAAIRVRADMQMELVAAEPAVMDPIDLAWGADGRIWVVEMADYPRGMDGAGQPGGRVRARIDSRRRALRQVDLVCPIAPESIAPLGKVTATGGSEYGEIEYHNFTGTLNHRVAEKLYVELALNHSSRHSHAILSGDPAIAADLNYRLPDGSLNPYFFGNGYYFMQVASFLRQKLSDKNLTFRGSASYDLNLGRRLVRIGSPRWSSATSTTIAGIVCAKCGMAGPLAALRSARPIRLRGGATSRSAPPGITARPVSPRIRSAPNRIAPRIPRWASCPAAPCRRTRSISTTKS
jgi:hypothetical protein